MIPKYKKEELIYNKLWNGVEYTLVYYEEFDGPRSNYNIKRTSRIKEIL